MNVFNLSFGKDSMATLILAAEQGIPIDRVMYCDIRFSPELSGEYPLMAAWIPTAEQRLKELFGITVDHVYSGVSFYEQFYKVKQKGNHVGDIYGFPYVIDAWCNGRLKLRAIKKYEAQFRNNEITTFVGIAYDEPVRWERMKKKQTDKHKYRSLLYEQKITEQEAFEICRRYDLLSPMYTSGDGIYRGGCWFCVKQCLADLYSLWKNYREYFDILAEIERVSVNTFRAEGITLKELAEKFSAGYIPTRRKKRLPYVQMDMFDMIDTAGVPDFQGDCGV